MHAEIVQGRGPVLLSHGSESVTVQVDRTQTSSTRSEDVQLVVVAQAHRGDQRHDNDSRQPRQHGRSRTLRGHGRYPARPDVLIGSD